MLGLGSTYRCSGEYQKSAELLREGVRMFPGWREFEASLIELVDSSLFTSYYRFQHYLSLKKNKDWQTAIEFLSTLGKLETYSSDQARKIILLYFTFAIEKIDKLALMTIFLLNLAYVKIVLGRQ